MSEFVLIKYMRDPRHPRFSGPAVTYSALPVEEWEGLHAERHRHMTGWEEVMRGTEDELLAMAKLMPDHM